MRGYGWLAIALAATLTACGGGGSARTALVPVNAAAGASTDEAVRAILCQIPGDTGGWGQVVHAVPNVLTLNLCAHEIGTFDAVENFEGITTRVTDPRIVSVSPDVLRNKVYPTQGGLKNAWFIVTPLAAGTTKIIVTDKKGNTDTVTVTVIGCPTPSPTPTPTATPKPTPTPMPTPTPKPTPTPTPAPTATPTPAPSATPTPAPTATPTPAPTATPSPAPTATPTPAPTATPSPSPSPCPNAARNAKGAPGTHLGVVVGVC